MVFLDKLTRVNLFGRSRTNKFVLLINSNNFTTIPETKTETEDNKQKILNVAVIGVPNAGKSTFINHLINHRICPTSSKVHTTRRSNKAIFTDNNTQIILHDTPGLVTKSEIKKYNLGSKFSSAYRDSIQHSDIIAVVHDVSNSWTRNELHSTVKETLEFYNKHPSFLVLNKIDLLKSKRVLLELVRVLTNNTLGKSGSGIKRTNLQEKVSQKELPEAKLKGWSNFSDIYMVSSITGDGLNDIMRSLVSKAKNGDWKYPSEAYTDELPETIVVESVRARLLDYLPQEIPYKLQVAIEYFDNAKHTVFASVQIQCPNLRLERLLCGESNGKLKQITERVTSDLVETFNKPISLTITTIVNKSTKLATN